MKPEGETYRQADRDTLLHVYLRGENVMSRIPRVLAAAALSVALLVAAAPAAHARTLAKPKSPDSVIELWLSATLGWVNGLLTAAPQPQAAPRPQVKVTGIQTGNTGGGASPMTGSCVDPWGAARPCPGGGI
jgi:hypothetical protein